MSRRRVGRTARGVALLAVLAALAGGLAACGGGSSSTALERFANVLGHAPTGLAASIAEKGVLVVANDANYPPQSWVSKGKLVGFDVDVAERVGKILGVKVQYINPSWDAVPAGLKARTFAVSIGSMAPSAELKKTLDFTPPYYYMGGQLAVKKGGTKIVSVAGLSGRKVGVAAQSIYFYWLRDHTKANVVVYPADADALIELKSGRLDAVMAGSSTVAQEIASGEAVERSGEPLFYEGLAFAVRKNETDLLRVLSHAIQQMRADGTLSKLTKQWFDGADLSIVAK